MIAALLLVVAAAAAERLPAVNTVCIDRTGHRCWVVPGESQCQTGKDVFRVVLLPDTATAVKECETLLAAPPK